MLMQHYCAKSIGEALPGGVVLHSDIGTDITCKSNIASDSRIKVKPLKFNSEVGRCNLINSSPNTYVLK